MGRSILRAFGAFCVVSVFFLTPPAKAQRALPGTVQPGQIERRLAPPTPPRSTLAPIVIPAPTKRLPPKQAAKIHFVLSGIVVSGSTVYKQTDFLPLYKKYLGKKVSVATLYKIADAITAKYRDDGYILSRAYVPQQRIKGGVARIAVVEGYVDKVEWKGKIRGRPALFRAYAAKITASRPLQLAVLERYLLLAGDLAGNTVHSVFEPSPTHPGAARLIAILKFKPVDAQIGLDNRGTKTLGPVELNLFGAVNNALGLYGRSALNIVLTPQHVENLQYYRFQQQETLDSEGTTAVGEITAVRTNPGDILAPLDVHGRDVAVALNFSHPFIRSRDENLYAGIGFTYRDVTIDELGVRTGDDRTRALTARVEYDSADPWHGINQVIANVSRGLPAFGATPEFNPLSTRPNGDSSFTKFDIYASRLQHLSDHWSILGQASAQKSANSLPAAEQFWYGGEPFGRAYDPSEITGDDGIAGSVELRFTPSLPSRFFRTLQLFAYYDIGEVSSRIHPGTSGSATGASTGFGFRLTPRPFLYATLEVDKPLTRIVAANVTRDWRAFFQVIARY